MTITLKKTVFVLIVLWGVYIVLGAVVKDYFLKNKGICGKGTLINELVYVKSHKNTLCYEFKFDGKTYKRNSLEEDPTKIGDSVCIVYLESFPSINRPLKYFSPGEIKCDCK
jgi:hypothetical protein